MIHNEKATKKPLWKKKTGGGLNLHGIQIIKGDSIRATEEELGSCARQFDMIEGGGKPEPKSEAQKPAEPKPVENKEEQFELKHLGRGWYDIYSKEGKKMNEVSLRTKEAKEKKEQLEGGE